MAAKPDKDLLTMIAGMPWQSACSKSQVVNERDFKDGSVLYVTSRQGGAVKFDARPRRPTTPPVPSS